MSTSNVVDNRAVVYLCCCVCICAVVYMCLVYMCMHMRLAVKIEVNQLLLAITTLMKLKKKNGDRLKNKTKNGDLYKFCTKKLRQFFSTICRKA